jgi:hypothetical protein
MKIKELIAKLEKLDPEYRIILSKDAEGNTFSPLVDDDDMTIAKYEPYTDEDGKELWYGELEIGMPNAVILYPVN